MLETLSKIAKAMFDNDNDGSNRGEGSGRWCKVWNYYENEYVSFYYKYPDGQSRLIKRTKRNVAKDKFRANPQVLLNSRALLIDVLGEDGVVKMLHKAIKCGWTGVNDAMHILKKIEAGSSDGAYVVVGNSAYPSPSEEIRKLQHQEEKRRQQGQSKIFQNAEKFFYEATILPLTEKGFTKDILLDMVEHSNHSRERTHLQYCLGLMYEFGKGEASKDEARAVEFYKIAAQQGHSNAQYRLSKLTPQRQRREQERKRQQEEEHHQQVEKLFIEYPTANPVEQYKLGDKYYNEGDYVKAVELYRITAEQGYVKALNSLGYMYGTGRGVEKDDIKAVTLYRKAAELGNAAAQYNLGLMYANGRGIAKDSVQAVYWYREAAKQGYVSALEALEEHEQREIQARQAAKTPFDRLIALFKNIQK